MTAAEDDIHERIAELLPEANRAGYYRHIARVRKLHPDDDILALVEACGYLTLLCVEVPKALADARAEIEQTLTRLGAAAPSNGATASAGPAEVKALTDELARFNRNFGETQQEIRSVKEYPRLAERLRSRSQLVVGAFALLAIAGSFFGFKLWADQTIARNTAAARQQFQESGEFVQDIRGAGGSFRYYPAQDQAGRPTAVMVVSGGGIRDAGMNKEGGAFIVLNR